MALALTVDRIMYPAMKPRRLATVVFEIPMHVEVVDL